MKKVILAVSALALTLPAGAVYAAESQAAAGDSIITSIAAPTECLAANDRITNIETGPGVEPEKAPRIVRQPCSGSQLEEWSYDPSTKKIYNRYWNDGRIERACLWSSPVKVVGSDGASSANAYIADCGQTGGNAMQWSYDFSSGEFVSEYWKIFGQRQCLTAAGFNTPVGENDGPARRVSVGECNQNSRWAILSKMPAAGKFLKNDSTGDCLTATSLTSVGVNACSSSQASGQLWTVERFSDKWGAPLAYISRSGPDGRKWCLSHSGDDIIMKVCSTGDVDQAWINKPDVAFGVASKVPGGVWLAPSDEGRVKLIPSGAIKWSESDMV
ncbi:hypothetical protein ACFV0H_40820 [Streptomyces erythrochromogenes]|uniref:hypothetical protein n=1 Tax=Streptomyces erythrochromogenes TaxID=285574 RepID=UPI0036C786E7